MTKVRAAILLVAALFLATLVAGQEPSTASAQQASSTKRKCLPAPLDATAWFNPCVYLQGNGVKLGHPVSLPDPKYSESARRAQIKGNVLLAVALNAGGAVDAIKVVRSLEPSLDQNAVDAVKQWKFMPATKDGKNVAVQMEVTVGFDLY